MNSTKILFLKMLKGDIKRQVSENSELLTGQTITLGQIESFPSYKLMNDDERAIVKSILAEMKSDKGENEKGKALLKHIDSLVPQSSIQEVEFKEAS